MITNQKQYYPLGAARQAADTLIGLLSPACHQIAVAGSVRRGKAQVHDIDLVAWPIYEAMPITDLFGEVLDTLYRASELYRVVKASPAKNVAISMRKIAFAWPHQFLEIPVDVWLVEPDGSNWGALLQMRTGPLELNRVMCNHAADRGLHYKAGHGIYRLDHDGQCTERVDDGTEAGIFAALGMPCREPELR